MSGMGIQACGVGVYSCVEGMCPFWHVESRESSNGGLRPRAVSYVCCIVLHCVYASNVLHRVRWFWNRLNTRGVVLYHHVTPVVLAKQACQVAKLVLAWFLVLVCLLLFQSLRRGERVIVSFSSYGTHTDTHTYTYRYTYSQTDQHTDRQTYRQRPTDTQDRHTVRQIQTDRDIQAETDRQRQTDKDRQR